MAPIKGIWGDPTSTLDWCEENYEITYYVAEFWNTISNFTIIFLSLMGLWHSKQAKLERRYFVCYFLMAVVGVGSFLFHMTLKFTMQLSDELPMIWASLVGLYTALEVNSKPKQTNFILSAQLTLAGILICLVYIYIREPLIHQTFYGLVVLFTTVLDLRTKHASMPMFYSGTAIFLLAFFLWNIDNTFCPNLSHLRSSMPDALKPVTQLHAWWHVLAGYGSYMHVVFSSSARAKFLKRPCSFKIGFSGVYLHCKDSKKTQYKQR